MRVQNNQGYHIDDAKGRSFDKTFALSKTVCKTVHLDLLCLEGERIVSFVF